MADVYTIKIPISNEAWVRDKLGVVFDLAHDLYNDSVAEVLKRIEELKSIPEYSNAMKRVAEICKELEDKNIDKDKKKELEVEKKSCYAVVNEYRKDKGLSSSSQVIQTNIVVPIKQSKQKYKGICSPFYSSISEDLAKSIEKYFYGNGEKIHFKSRKKGQTVSKLSGSRARGKSNIFAGVFFKFDVKRNIYCAEITYNGKPIIVPLHISIQDTYIWANLAKAFDIPFVPKTKNEIIQFNSEVVNYCNKNGFKFLTFPKVGQCGIVYENIRGIPRYYMTMCIDGKPFKKFGLNAISDARTNVCGIDIGTQTVALSFRNKEGYVFRTDLFELVEDIDNEYLNRMADVNRKMERSRRINNPDNFNEDGTIKRGRLDWIDSNNYQQLKIKNATMGRNITEAVKKSHSELIKYIFNLAHNVVIEDMNFSGLAKRAKETTYRTVEVEGKEVQRANRKSRFGKSIQKKSPATFVNMLKLAANEVGTEVLFADRFGTKASQYNHQTNEYMKKGLSSRWNLDLYYMGEEVKIQRDLYSAFLLAALNPDKSINQKVCEVGFDSFVEEHNRCLEEIKGTESQALKNILKK